MLEISDKHPIYRVGRWAPIDREPRHSCELIYRFVIGLLVMVCVAMMVVGAPIVWYHEIYYDGIIGDAPIFIKLLYVAGIIGSVILAAFLFIIVAAYIIVNGEALSNQIKLYLRSGKDVKPVEAEPKPPGVVKELYRSFKEKYCIPLDINKE